MSTYPVAAFIVASCLALTGSAHAATKSKSKPKPVPKPVPPPCHIVTDPLGDNPTLQPGGTSGPLYDANLDITSADIANNASVVTGVIRLARLDQSDSMAPTGRSYSLIWSYAMNGTGGYVNVRLTPTGMSTYPSAATASIDYTHAEIHITSPIEALDGHPIFAHGDALTLSASTDIALPAAPSPVPDVPVRTPTSSELGDEAQAPKPYVLYSPNCVKPGA